MIKIDLQHNPKDFLEQCGAFIAQNAAEHNLILTLCSLAEKKIKAGEQSGIRFFTLFNDGEFALAAVRTLPHNLLLSRAQGADILPLAEKLATEEPDIPGIVGPSDIAASFAEIWTKLTGRKSVAYMDQIIYALKTVHPRTAPDGAFRMAKPDEAEIIARWIHSFATDTLPKTEQFTAAEALTKAQDLIAGAGVAVWTVKGKPAAMAGVSGTDALARISLVYTPPEQRGHGYASAVVASLSQKQFDQGRKMCCLYADARNPVSNSIYRKIGYEFVGRSSLYVLDQAA